MLLTIKCLDWDAASDFFPFIIVPIHNLTIEHSSKNGSLETMAQFNLNSNLTLQEKQSLR